MEKKPRLSKRDQEAARKYGGSDTWAPPTTDPTYFDKGGHKERSIINQPQHSKHWTKENGKV